jgi:hypothetical protein
MERSAHAAGSRHRNLGRTLYALAVIPIVAGAVGVVFGGSSIPASGEPTAAVESELRFYAVWWIGAGLFMVWLAPRVAEHAREFRVFCALLFLSGLSRGLAVLDAGWPPTGLVVLMAAELTISVALFLWDAGLRRGAG